ncbi:conserved Plasmodium protein, unknown function [Babesia microti strain RI]|uniref:Eukaryotic translation initiation factor 3 30 kDa subunit n=1 Tax=Babesia microti (strain RI) TaxID=1133968 RepID=A0A1R4AAD0_BABMR|nr:conserved Plasmodium protein, unknown function [Babesia microti strain RI]SJK85953.1 conserved Plasmodium protein, unknown function [Babesia microti strain RI]|eukprot:XP_021338157.1 conserved Plasmodium protein, unknown function [Babesia microti strain RI]
MPHYDSDEDFMDGSATSHANPLDNWESFDDCHVTPLSEKLNNQKISEEADIITTRDLFSGHTKPLETKKSEISVFKKIVVSDPYETIKLNTLKDCETVARKLSEKIVKSPAKGAVWVHFIDILLQSCQSKMEYKELITLKKKVEALVKTKEDLKRDLEYSKKKPNAANFRSYKDELDMMYGDLTDEDDY